MATRTTKVYFQVLSKLSVYAAWTAGLFGTALFIFLVVFVCALRHLNNRQGALYRPPPGLPEKDKEKKKTKTTRSGVYHLLPSEKKKSSINILRCEVNVFLE